jgi:hypothetical protein
MESFSNPVKRDQLQRNNPMDEVQQLEMFSPEELARLRLLLRGGPILIESTPTMSESFIEQRFLDVMNELKKRVPKPDKTWQYPLSVT